ncbi:MAG: aminodeoxychorismate/anthranilate synthase component II, partial [Bdellovibrionota bacterium]|nr:aminodeoxychorismate/anthranilate synthase component II [Bdellovibrionota bacterium]
MILLIDNYDSFTFNLYQYLVQEGLRVKVFRNDKISIDKIINLKPSAIVLSPGPGQPKEAGIGLKLVEIFYKKVPILGICLGHQIIAEFFGGKII